MIEHRLANILLQVEPRAAAYPGIWYHAGGGSVEYVEATRAEDDAAVAADTTVAGTLRITGIVDFTTYLNGISAAKWQRYTGVDDIRLHLELAGDGCELLLEGVPEGQDELVTCGTVRVSAGEGAVDVRIPTAGMTLAGFAIRTQGEVLLRAGHYYARVDESQVNDVRLAIASTTFKKEDFITANARRLTDAVRAADGPIRDRFHMFVVDNGRTLAPADFARADGTANDLVTLIPNDNVGGSGGFARGMMAALDDPAAYTHVILMDDDISILPEAVLRTFSLLRLARGAYRDACVQGAMLTLEEPNLSYEDVSVVERSGHYHPIKQELHIDSLPNLLANERADVELDQTYGAWWYSCIPLAAVREKGLPLPLFVRCDDIEYGVRLRTRYMAMDGICVWHQGFAGKFRASVDLYQYIRNFLIVCAADDMASDRLIVTRIRRDVRLRLRDYDYVGAELLLDALEDYLAGPDFIATAKGADIMREKGAQNEKMVPLAELGLAPETLAEVDRLRAAEADLLAAHPDHIFGPSLRVRLVQTLPYDPHTLPGAAADPLPAVLPYHGNDHLRPDQLRHASLLWLDTSFENGVLRHIDRDRYRRDMRRMHDLVARWRRDGAAIRRSYQDALPRLASEAFWRSYLGMDQQAGGAGRGADSGMGSDASRSSNRDGEGETVHA